ncbi:MAG: hydrogenase [Candidatus Eisenbacteria bacterium]|nr:hydrogenase [Candidatus Eisenbacteria bacterium]
MNVLTPLELSNGAAFPLAEAPPMAVEVFRGEVIRECRADARLAALFGRRLPSGDLRLQALLAHDAEGRLTLCGTDLRAGVLEYPALTPEAHEAHWFERELAEQFRAHPRGHPWLKPLRAHPVADGPEYPYFAVEGSGIHEVAVGPVHAGVIEPGHFRFQCDGERVLHLEIHLGYQHRGVEDLLAGARDMRAVALAESIAGDSSVAHALAHCEAVEALAGTEPPLRAQALRAVALELERVANHVGDLGALCNDIGFLPGASWFGRMRGDALGLSLALTGNRYGRGFVRPGGVSADLDAGAAASLAADAKRLDAEVREVAEVLFSFGQALARFEGTGPVDYETAESLGLVGPAGRASGCDRDVRRDHPSGFYRFTHVPVVVLESGDVNARALVRRLEAQHSLAFIRETLTHLPAGPVLREVRPLPPESASVALVEAWRGEVVHLLFTGADGSIERAKVVDPSFHNWMGLAMALRGGDISDFPLCNKSFNLSYAGHDL